MITLTKQQIGQRWDTLPENLREALASETNSDFIWSTCEAQNIPDKQIYNIAADVAAVLMGFLHADDAPEAFKTDAGIDTKTAALLQDAFDKKIFAPLKQAIDGIYKPSGAPEIKTSIIPNPNAPKTFDIATASSKSTASPAVPLPPKPSFSNKGWSEIRPAALPSIQSAARSTPAAPNILRPTNLPRPPKPPKPPVIEPAPMIIGGTNFTGAPQKNTDFHLSKTGGGAQVDFGQAKPQSKVMPAFIEFSKPAQTQSTSRPSTPVTSPVPTTPTFKTMPVANSGPRNVTEITSNTPPKPAIPKPPAPNVAPVMTPPIPKPPAAAQPPKPPAPPMATAQPSAAVKPSSMTQPATQQPKIITKNFP